MRRRQIYIPEDLDDALQSRAAETGRSKASLIRECVATHFWLCSGEDDPLSALVGSVDIDPQDIDEVVYGR
jgi:hypothetical protein